MKIRSLRLEHFRKFTDPVVLAGFSDGINVLAEANEFGKSTLLAAIRGVLFERYASKGASVKQMQHSINRTSPFVSLEFELPAGVYRIEKRFLHREPFAKLTLPNGAIHQNDAAEEHLQHALNFTPGGPSGSKPENLGMWAALWVLQRDSADQAQLTDSARQTIHGCLDQEVGTLAGGSRGRKIVATVRAELARIRDGNKKPTGRYKEAVAGLIAAQTSATELEAKLARLVKDIAELETIRRKLADCGDRSEEARTHELLKIAKQDREAAQQYEEKHRTAVATLTVYERDEASARKEIADRAQRERALEQLTLRVQTLSQEEAATLTELQAAEASLAKQRNAVTNAETALDLAVERLHTAKRVAALALTSAHLEKFRERLALAETAQFRVNSLVARLSSLSITEADAAHLREMEARLRQTEATMEAQATHLEFRLLFEAAGRVRLNGGPLGTTAHSLLEDTSVSIEGVGELIIKPGIQDRSTLLHRRELEQRELRGALQAVAAGSVLEAEQRCAARKQCEAELAEARRDLTALTPADLPQKLGAGMEALRNHISVLEARLQQGMIEASRTQLPAMADAEAAVVAAESEEREAKQRAVLERAPLQGLADRHTAVSRAQAGIAADRRNAADELTRSAAALEQRLVDEGADALATRFRSATAALLQQQGIIEAMERSRPPETVASLDARIRRYGLALKDYEKTRNANQQRQAILQSQIEREEGVGVEEQGAAARQRVESLQRECDRYEREVRVLELLLETLEQAEKEAKERYMAPVVQRITPYLQTLFPGAAIHCDEQFRVTGIIRELQQTETFDGLSVGTQEQLAILTRLAFAEMLLEKGKPATVILDDALVYSDPERMERMFDLLTQAAQRTQILILTCREDLFTRLGGTRLRVCAPR